MLFKENVPVYFENHKKDKAKYLYRKYYNFLMLKSVLYKMEWRVRFKVVIEWTKNKGVARKGLQNFVLLFSQNLKEISAIFSVVNFECPACYCSATEQCVFSRMHWAFTKMACYGDVPFKQRAVSELIVARKGLATNIHKPLKMYMVSLLLIKTLLVVRLHELQVLRKAKRNWKAASLWLAGNSRHFRRCFNMLMLFETT